MRWIEVAPPGATTSLALTPPAPARRTRRHGHPIHRARRRRRARLDVAAGASRRRAAGVGRCPADVHLRRPGRQPLLHRARRRRDRRTADRSTPDVLDTSSPQAAHQPGRRVDLRRHRLERPSSSAPAASSRLPARWTDSRSSSSFMALGDGTHKLPVRADLRARHRQAGGRHRDDPPDGAPPQLTVATRRCARRCVPQQVGVPVVPGVLTDQLLQVPAEAPPVAGTDRGQVGVLGDALIGAVPLDGPRLQRRLRHRCIHLDVPLGTVVGVLAPDEDQLGRRSSAHDAYARSISVRCRTRPSRDSGDGGADRIDELGVVEPCALLLQCAAMEMEPSHEHVAHVAIRRFRSPVQRSHGPTVPRRRRRGPAPGLQARPWNECRASAASSSRPRTRRR